MSQYVRYNQADFSPGSMSWARSLPAGYAMHTSYGKWEPAPHLLLVQSYLLALLSGELACSDGEAAADGIIVSMPPRHGKSMFISQYFLGWYLGIFPNNEVILTSYEAGLAGMFGGRVRDLTSEFGPNVWKLDVRADKRAAGDWLLSGRDSAGVPVHGGMRAAGVGSGVTGRGGNLIVIDDPFKDAKQANSETYRNTVWDWYMSTLFTRLEPGAKQIVVMTRWHEDDLVGRFLERAEEQEGVRWATLELPALCTDPENDPLGRAEGDALWPERWSREALLKIRATMTPYWWSALYQQKPAPAEGNIFKRQWWRFWQPKGANLQPVRVPGCEEVAELVELPDIRERALSWDLSFKKNEDSSFVVGQEWGWNKADAFLLDQDRARRDFPETLVAFKKMVCGSKAQAKWVEDAANGAALIAVVRKEIPGVIPIPVQGSKEDRARAITHYIEAGNVYLPHPQIAPWVWELIEETAGFGAGGKNDDQVDAMSQALAKIFTKERQAVVFGKARM